MTAHIISVSCNDEYAFSKPVRESITLIEGLGVEGDVHSGITVKHRSRIRRDPTVLNLRQVHLIHAELFGELAAQGFDVKPGDIGENILTKDIALLDLPTGTRLQIGDAVIELTGLRNPCKQLNNFQPGLMYATLDKDEDGNLIRKAGVMGIVISSGRVAPGDEIEIELPAKPHSALEPV